MRPVFDEKGLATEPGDIRCFYYDAVTSEYTGWSDEYINVGVSMPGHSTDKDPGDEVSGEVAVFTDGAWRQEEDHRGETVYSILDGSASIVDYLGAIAEGYTQLKPATRFDKWDGKQWVTDTGTQHVAAVAAANQQKQVLLDNAAEVTSDWKTELALGIISDEDKESLIQWMNYTKKVKAVDTSKAPDITWEKPPSE
ncbi:Prophage tail fiber assembly protein TfaE [Citrobacter freundii]|uniref:tail fiber assembly protein n=1 Tax=Citrobacter freundii TaxID=546 RepID=UPI001DBD423C|nr:tail fiber assembly protein [Citrobacter freundii]CAG0338814.1 Prophage tail fiber assembly protein TfaE [Citrobacter freundii]CAH6020928.1 Prophage tail fiber assembly protein TfaE [Citrobacter freundii]